MSKEPCRKHHFQDYGRCAFCQMQRRYYSEAMATLNSWSEKEKKTKEWKTKVASIEQCKPHFHEG